MLLLMPCGFHLTETLAAWERTRRPPGYDDLAAVRRGHVFALDGSAYFSRPGPRVIDGIELLAEIFDPDAFVDVAPLGSWTPVGPGATRAGAFSRDVRLPVVRARPTCRGPDDLEGWAQLCPDCVGKAGDNGFLRFRLRQALTDAVLRRGGRGRGRADGPAEAAEPPVAGEPDRPDDPRRRRTMLAYYEARAPEYDDWYLRRGRYERGPIHDAAWNAELDAAGRWLDELPIRGEIVELAAGTGWWSPLLASKGELSLYDGTAAPLERARERLVAHQLRAHLHVRDAWAEPDRPVDALFTGFWLSHVPRGPAGRVPRARPALAQARRHVRVHRLAGGPAIERSRPPDTGRRRLAPSARRRPRVHDRQGLLQPR